MKKFKFKLNIKRELRIGAILCILVLLIAFSEQKQAETAIQDIQVKLENIHENHFLDENDVIDMMQLSHENMRGASVSKINFGELEDRVKNDRFVKDADVYTDLKGNMVVRVMLHRPIARITRNDGPDGYIAEDGTVMPVSDKFTARVVLLSGSYANQLLRMENLHDDKVSSELCKMLTMIHDDEFLRAQAAQLDIGSGANITIYPQIGGQLIEFGKPENMEIKFKKLKIFYKDILPQMGWNKYRRVNLEYEGQIVAE
jgi:cell division protein FtsQ